MRTFSQPSPICLIAYNRPNHLQRTLNALANNRLAGKSPIYIFIDGAKTPSAKYSISKTYQTCLQFKDKFLKMEITQRTENLGLADNIVDSVSSVLQHYPKVIVMEDDIQTSPVFLDYLNNALHIYEDDNRIGHINCFSCRQGLGEEAFLTNLMMCWGWATWRDSWQRFSRNHAEIDAKMSTAMIDSFSHGGRIKNWQQYLDNKHNKTKTWAVYWALCLHINAKYCLHPPLSLSHNIGNDGSGTHSKGNNHFDVEPSDKVPNLPISPAFHERHTTTLVNRLFPGNSR